MKFRTKKAYIDLKNKILYIYNNTKVTTNFKEINQILVNNNFLNQDLNKFDKIFVVKNFYNDKVNIEVSKMYDKEYLFSKNIYNGKNENNKRIYVNDFNEKEIINNIEILSNEINSNYNEYNKENNRLERFINNKLIYLNKSTKKELFNKKTNGQGRGEELLKHLLKDNNDFKYKDLGGVSNHYDGLLNENIKIEIKELKKRRYNEKIEYFDFRFSSILKNEMGEKGFYNLLINLYLNYEKSFQEYLKNNKIIYKGKKKLPGTTFFQYLRTEEYKEYENINKIFKSYLKIYFKDTYLILFDDYANLIKVLDYEDILKYINIDKYDETRKVKRFFKFY